MSRHIALGAAGERAAERFLRAHKFRILERNWRCHAGEIDIVAREGEQLVIIEVKTRSSTSHGHPFEALTPTKIARLYRLGILWAAAHRHRGSIRLDAIAVTLNDSGAPTIEHLRSLTQ